MKISFAFLLKFSFINQQSPIISPYPAKIVLKTFNSLLSVFTVNSLFS